jgi:cation transport ATPase
LRLALQLAESLRDYAFAMVAELKRRGIEPHLVSRDSRGTAEAVARQLGTESFHTGFPGSGGPSHSRMAGRRRGRYGWRLARKSIRVVGQNLFVVALFNTGGIILAVSEQLTASKSTIPSSE